MFNKISIIGCGLIGSSILRAVEEKKLASKISAFDKSSKVTDYLKKNFSAEICSNLSNVVKDSDLIIIASPLSSYKEILLSIQSNLKKNIILTDTGSAKKEVNKIINNLNLKRVDLKKFPLVKILNQLPNKSSLFETVIVAANDKLVEYYLNRQIKFDEIQIKLLKFINNKEFRKFKRIKPKKIENIINLSEYVRLKINV